MLYRKTPKGWTEDGRAIPAPPLAVRAAAEGFPYAHVTWRYGELVGTAHFSSFDRMMNWLKR